MPAAALVVALVGHAVAGLVLALLWGWPPRAGGAGAAGAAAGLVLALLWGWPPRAGGAGAAAGLVLALLWGWPPPRWWCWRWWLLLGWSRPRGVLVLAALPGRPALLVLLPGRRCPPRAGAGAAAGRDGGGRWGARRDPPRNPVCPLEKISPENPTKNPLREIPARN